ncbi:short-chain fatty acid transporter [Rossellomorea marisflavi]|uniref:Short-chain fatty acid transporter n=1 Tax=Rossellomorea marisflavi TaxID=189381 RepID=A0A161T693_9BACI|nr:TIGR00366 family protein [Rossellomorea marisflavi]KZE48673.1 short-chain fatty acid transporter [Rossellomorea marisflavi]MCM2605356.1 TIGR00366 family protein [Rossellomorea marisflavi]TYO71144.1 short-chain fatty acid transporter [Rossellomorea marisflavi]
MLASIADRLSRLVQRYLPDAFVIAVLLTLLVFGIGIFLKPAEPLSLVKSFGDGFWVYLTFTMQMVLLLLTGMVLASVPFVKKGLQQLAEWADTPTKAYVYTFCLSGAAYYINWGLAVVVGAILVREIGRRNPNVHFPLLVAAAYSPTALYTAGLSSSIGLTVATNDHFLVDLMGVIPTSETIFSPSTIIIFLVLFVTMPVVICLMAPKGEVTPYEEKITQKKVNVQTGVEATPASRLETTPILGVVTGLIGMIYVIHEFILGRDLDLNIINLLFLSLGLIFHGSLRSFGEAFKEAAGSTSPIILQFPFYAGIIAVLTSSGLGESIIQGMTSIANKETFDIFTYWTAGIVNLLAPSGGGQWALQGPLQVPAGMNLGVEPSTIAMAVGWGDAWTNLIQPFWALPILSIVGLHIRHIMGYCFILAVWVGVVTTVLMLFLY